MLNFAAECPKIEHKDDFPLCRVEPRNNMQISNPEQKVETFLFQFDIHFELREEQNVVPYAQANCQVNSAYTKFWNWDKVESQKYTGNSNPQSETYNKSRFSCIDEPSVRAVIHSSNDNGSGSDFALVW